MLRTAGLRLQKRGMKMLKWLDENLEEFLMGIFLVGMVLIMGIQVLARYVLGASLSWSEGSSIRHNS